MRAALTFVFWICVLAATAQAQGKLEGASLDGPSGRLLINPLIEEGQNLSPDQAEALGKKLERNPKDLATRFRLLGYQSSAARDRRDEPIDSEPHGKLVLGLIEHHPRSVLAGSAGWLLSDYSREGLYKGTAWDKAIELWLKLAQTNKTDAKILGNAGTFLLADVFRWKKLGPQAKDLLERAHKLEAENPRWAMQLGWFYFMKMRFPRTKEEIRIRSQLNLRAWLPSAARRVLHYLEQAYRLTEEPKRGSLQMLGQPLLQVLAETAIAAGEAKKAHTYAKDALSSVKKKKDPADWNRGNVIYSMNVILGRVALDEGDLKKAGQHLLEAGKTPGSPQLNSFGPDMTLARDMLKKGEREVVLEFLELCGKFWKSGQKRLEEWTRAIKEGKNPWSPR